MVDTYKSYEDIHCLMDSWRCASDLRLYHHSLLDRSS